MTTISDLSQDEIDALRERIARSVRAYHDRERAHITFLLNADRLRREGIRRDTNLMLGPWRPTLIDWLRAWWSWWWRP